MIVPTEKINTRVVYMSGSCSGGHGGGNCGSGACSCSNCNCNCGKCMPGEAAIDAYKENE